MLGSTTSQAFQAFIDRWTEELQEAENVFGDKLNAHLMKVFLEELHEMRMAELAVELTVPEAASVSGYHPSSIWRMVDDGDLDAIEDTENTRILATALPLKMKTRQAETSDSEWPDAEQGDATAPPLGAAELEVVND